MHFLNDFPLLKYNDHDWLQIFKQNKCKHFFHLNVFILKIVCVYKIRHVI